MHFWWSACAAQAGWHNPYRCPRSEDVRSSPAADWEIYSHFLEEPVAVRPEKLGTGKYKIAPASELLPGEYGLVLRPISKSKKFSGGDVARSQGDGLMFNTVWTFKISDSAE